ncbi:MAG: trypsin-like serine protease [Salinivirgaceae bacterium]|nr:trypsin-like serine protease [Salinivirgaceae bacterium]
MKLSFTGFLVMLFSIGFSQNPMGIFPLTTMVNNIEYTDSNFSKNNIGCGFLLKVDKDTFAVTAKHILLLAKTDQMKTIGFEGGLKSWTMHPKDKPEEQLILGDLLNEDKTDSTNWDFFNRNYYTNHDWLIFNIKENNSKVKPIELRKTELKNGEPLYVLGWTYEDTVGLQRTYIYTYIEPKGTHFNMRRINAPENGSGLSGSPVVDADGFVVGTISGMDENPETGEQYSSPCNVDFLVKFFEGYYK